MIDRPMEEAFHLRRMEVQQNHMGDPRALHEVGSDARRDRIKPAVPLVGSSIAKIRDDGDDTISGRSATRVRKDEQLHQMIVDGGCSRLNDEDVTTTNRLMQTHRDLPIGESLDMAGTGFRTEFARDCCGALGALASGGVRILDDDLIRVARVSAEDIERVTAAEQIELERRERRYRGDRPFPDLTGKTVLLVDDGLATGSTMRAAVAALRQEVPRSIVVAVPVAAPATCDAFRDIADDIVCAVTPEPFRAVGLWYDDFSQTTDEEVHELLVQAGVPPGSRRPAGQTWVPPGTASRS